MRDQNVLPWHELMEEPPLSPPPPPPPATLKYQESENVVGWANKVDGRSQGAVLLLGCWEDYLFVLGVGRLTGALNATMERLRVVRNYHHYCRGQGTLANRHTPERETKKSPSALGCVLCCDFK